jgi:transposase-like protein
MPRSSPYRILLTAAEQEVLERAARAYTSSYCDVIRAKIVLLAAEGLSNKSIGERMDQPRQIVSKWRKRFFEERLAGLHDLPRHGRPPVFSPSGRG